MKRIAVVGYGFMGMVHAQAIRAAPGLELCGIVSSRPRSCLDHPARIGNQEGVGSAAPSEVPIHATLAECVANQHPDAVSICLPLGQHVAAVQEALELGLDVLVEKPFCPEVRQCRTLIDLAAAKRRILMVAHCVRFHPAWELLAACIADGRHGDLRLLTTSRMGGEPTWGTWQDPAVRQASGGALLDLLIHDIDFVIACLGRPRAASLHVAAGEYREVELSYPGQVRISVKGGFLHRNTGFQADYAATFARASLRYSTLQPEIVLMGSDAGAETIRVPGDPYRNEMTYFAACIAGRRQPQRCPSEESMLAVATCLDLRRQETASAPSLVSAGMF